MKFVNQVLAVKNGDENTPPDPLLAMQMFQEELNKPPAKSWIKKDYRGFPTVPIGKAQGLLDSYFLGQWSTTNFKWNQVENELVGSIELCVINPILEVERCVTGSAGVQIMTTKPSDQMTKREKLEHNLDLENKIANCLESVFPRLEAMCFKSACKKLGRRFGRDLGRDDTFTTEMSLFTESDNAIMEELHATA